MRPYDFGTRQRLDYAKEHAEYLRTEWRKANGYRHRDLSSIKPDNNEAGNSAFSASRHAVGRGLVRLGMKLLPSRGAARTAARGYRTDPC